MLNSKLSNVSGVSGMSPVKSVAPSVMSGMNQSNSMGRSATKFKKPMMPKLAMVDYEALMPAKEELLEKLEPFLKNQMGLYGGYVNLTLKDVQEIISQELYKHLKVNIM